MGSDRGACRLSKEHQVGRLTDAAASKAEIEQIGRAIAAKYRGGVSAAPIKSDERVSEKVGTDYDGDWHSIKDLARMTIIVPTLAARSWPI
ncbi:hypothetical protein JHL17_15730 [Azospirillum sp. YIM B02556]|uniref:Uncharacterized protein n=1 Tax=Azospirillum endophyticum TaxID=2800326 RepID=A0ABS1F604_9PROT|nr:hypothetical protein [Azospirillum endophyticum]MBK1838869.1 hypothetical protein [Azospirillum endophyticum]